MRHSYSPEFLAEICALRGVESAAAAGARYGLTPTVVSSIWARELGPQTTRKQAKDRHAEICAVRWQMSAREAAKKFGAAVSTIKSIWSRNKHLWPKEPTRPMPSADLSCAHPYETMVYVRGEMRVSLPRVRFLEGSA